MDSVYIGNAETDGQATRGWIIGHFIEQNNIRHSDKVEIKWSTHEAGEARDKWAEGVHKKSIAIMVAGTLTLIFPDKEVVLEKPGDYVVWTKGVPHKWRANKPSTVITIRWPANVTR